MFPSYMFPTQTRLENAQLMIICYSGNLNFTASNHTLSDVTEDHESSVESHSSDDGSESSARRDCGSADVRLQCMNQIEQSEVLSNL